MLVIKIAEVLLALFTCHPEPITPPEPITSVLQIILWINHNKQWNNCHHFQLYSCYWNIYQSLQLNLV